MNDNHLTNNLMINFRYNLIKDPSTNTMNNFQKILNK